MKDCVAAGDWIPASAGMTAHHAGYLRDGTLAGDTNRVGDDSALNDRLSFVYKGNPG